MIPATISFPPQPHTIAKEQMQAMQTLREKSEDDESVTSCRGQNEQSGDEGSEIMVMVIPLSTEPELRRVSINRRTSWKFNTDWAFDSSFTSKGTEGQSSLYEFLDMDPLDDYKEEKEKHELPLVHRPSFSRGRSFKRGSIHEAVLSNDQFTSFHASTSSQEDLADAIDECLASDLLAAEDQYAATADDGEAVIREDPSSLQDSGIITLKARLGELVNMESDLAHNLSCHKYNTKEIEMLQDRVKNLQVLDEELVAVKESKAKAA